MVARSCSLAGVSVLQIGQQIRQLDVGLIQHHRGSNLRLSGLYTRFADVWDAVGHLQAVLASSQWREARFNQRGRVT